MNEDIYFAIGIDSDDLVYDQYFVTAARSKEKLKDQVKNNYTTEDYLILNSADAVYIATQILKNFARYANKAK